MEKIVIRKNRDYAFHDLYGHVTKRKYYYTIAVRKWFFFWRHIKFFPGGDEEKSMWFRCFTAKSVYCSFYFEPRYATHFSEFEAINILADIKGNPKKYYT